ncbi:MAG: hypothetical protein AB7I18_00785 [Candidatus Berkiella sp.]
MATLGPHPQSREATPTSDMIGTLIASFAKLSLFQPADTIATNAVAGKECATQFANDFSKANWFGKFRMLYSGASVEMLKKVPSNSYRYPAQRAASNYLAEHYHHRFQELFGDHADAAQASVAGGVSATFEPLITQPLDTIAVHQQIHHRPILETIKTLTFRDCYRAAPVTGLLRNLPAGVALFGGSQWFNHLLGNDDNQSNGLNFAAKMGGGFASVVASQPGDVLKVNMQTHHWSLKETIQHIPVKQFFTNGAKFRLIGGFKAGVGFFLAEKAMNFSAELFGKKRPKI